MGANRQLNVVINTDTKKILLSKEKISQKQTFLQGDFPSFIIKSLQTSDHFFPLLFPKDSESLNFLDIRHPQVGANRRLKVNKHTDTQTDTQTYGQINLSQLITWGGVGGGGSQKKLKVVM